MVLKDKFKKRALFKIRVDVWRREHNCPEDRDKRGGLGGDRRRRLAWSDFLCWYAWSQAVTLPLEFVYYESIKREVYTNIA
jgi:hypothetical protein